MFFVRHCFIFVERTEFVVLRPSTAWALDRTILICTTITCSRRRYKSLAIFRTCVLFIIPKESLNNMHPINYVVFRRGIQASAGILFSQTDYMFIIQCYNQSKSLYKQAWVVDKFPPPLWSFSKQKITTIHFLNFIFSGILKYNTSKSGIKQPVRNYLRTVIVQFKED